MSEYLFKSEWVLLWSKCGQNIPHSPRDVLKVLKTVNSLPMKLSAGVDGISYSLLKEAVYGVIYPLTSLLNISLQKGQVPVE